MSELYMTSKNITSEAVIPAQAGIQYKLEKFWIPAFAGMTPTQSYAVVGSYFSHMV
jgi:hypothetical protein